MKEKIVLINYGLGNILSIANAMKRSLLPHQEFLVSSEASVLEKADRVILPGVGAFHECIQKIKIFGLDKGLVNFLKLERPFLGICAGMQLLANEGQEFENVKGFGVIPGVVKKLNNKCPHSGLLKLPHVGWATLEAIQSNWFQNHLAQAFYFTHSYGFFCENQKDVAASVRYGEKITATVLRHNVLGVQFHPEKSGEAGLRFLNQFCKWRPF